MTREIQQRTYRVRKELVELRRVIVVIVALAGMLYVTFRRRGWI